MIGYEFAELMVDNRRRGPSVGDQMGGPYLPKPEDRDGWTYRIRACRKFSSPPVTIAELRIVTGRWQFRQRELATMALCPWVWEDSIRADVSGCEIARRVNGGKLVKLI